MVRKTHLREQSAMSLHALSGAIDIMGKRNTRRELGTEVSYEFSPWTEKNDRLRGIFSNILHNRAEVSPEAKQYGRLRVYGGSKIDQGAEIIEQHAVALNRTYRLTLLQYSGRLGIIPYVEASSVTVSNEGPHDDGITFTHFKRGEDAAFSLVASTAGTMEAVGAVIRNIDALREDETKLLDKVVSETAALATDSHLKLVKPGEGVQQRHPFA